MVLLLKSIKAHQNKVWDLSAHDDLPLLASASSDKTSKIYKLSEEQNFPLIATLEDTHKRSVRSAAFKPHLVSSENNFVDLPALACGSFDSTISVWGIDEPEEFLDDEGDDDSEADNVARKQREAEVLSGPQNEWNLMALIEGHENEIKAVAWNKSGNLLASCSRDKTVWIWETDAETLEEFECVAVLSDHEHDIKHITWHPKMNLLASSSYDDTIRLFKQEDDDDDWNCVAILNGHKGTVWCSQFESPKSPLYNENTLRLVSASDDLTVRIWRSALKNDSNKEASDIPSSIKQQRDDMAWELQCVLPEAHRYPIYSVAWSPRTGKIATSGCDGLLVIYKESNGVWEVESVQKAAHGVYEVNKVMWCQLSNDREVLITAGDDGCINVWSE